MTILCFFKSEQVSRRIVRETDEGVGFEYLANKRKVFSTRFTISEKFNRMLN